MVLHEVSNFEVLERCLCSLLIMNNSSCRMDDGFCREVGIQSVMFGISNGASLIDKDRPCHRAENEYVMFDL